MVLAMPEDQAEGEVPAAEIPWYLDGRAGEGRAAGEGKPS